MPMPCWLARTASYVQGDTINVSWTTDQPWKNNWIGSFDSSADPNKHADEVVRVQHLGDARLGTTKITIPGDVDPGSYQLRFYGKSNKLLGTSADFPITAAPAPILEPVSKSLPAPNGRVGDPYSLKIAPFFRSGNLSTPVTYQISG